MKRNIVILPAAAAILSAALLSCEKETDTGNGTPGEEEVYDVVPVAESGWDIYTGTGYRYGASIIVNDDSSVDLWLAAPGGTFGEGVKTYLSDEKEAQPLGTEGTLAQYFEFDEEKYRIVGRSSKVVYNLGDPVKIRVKKANLEQKLLDYELVETGLEERLQETVPEEERAARKAARKEKIRGAIRESKKKKARMKK